MDYVSAMIDFEAAKSVDIVGFLDSPLWLDIDPYVGSGYDGFAKVCQDAYTTFHVTRLGSECFAAHWASGEAWKCIMGQYRMPHVRTPYLIMASQYDAFQLGRNGIKPSRITAPMEAYAIEQQR